jgi:hypothetical protein
MRVPLRNIAAVLARNMALAPLLAVGLLAAHSACGQSPRGGATSTGSSATSATTPVTSIPIVTRPKPAGQSATQRGGSPRQQTGAVRVTVTGDRVTVADVTNRLIISNWRPSLVNVPPSVRTTTKIKATVDGFDVSYEFSNKTNTAAAITGIPLPPLHLGPSIQYHDFEHSGWTVPLSGVGARKQATYPNELYSPVFVLAGSGTTVGISLQYPVLEYRHDASLSATSTSYGVWQPDVRFGGTMPVGDLWWGNNASVPPNQSQRYTVSVRFASTTADWKSTLIPYRDYFRTTYGPVAYTRQTSPIKGIAFAAMDRQSPQNPNGWHDIAGDPHRNGYRSAARAIEQALQTSSRVIVWAPTGLAYQNRSLNYPPQFASRWNDPGPGALAMRDAPEQFRRMNFSAGRNWGLWWGHAAEVSPGWDTLPLSRATLSNPTHRALLQSELRAAVAAGAKIIGLDAFAHSHNQIWNLTELLAFYRQEAPGVTFCTEGRACDVLHRLSPTWLDAFAMQNTSAGSKARIRGPFHLADFIVPGHETWAGMCYDRNPEPTLFGPNASPAAQSRDLHRIIQLGYVPVTWLPLNLDDVAATVPAQRE